MRHAPIMTAVVLSVWAAGVLAGSLNRDRDPVVIAGQALGPLLGTPVGEIIAFRYQSGWQQIPVQIDERKVVDFGTVYNQGPVGIVTLAYADAATYTGPDDDPAFDANDELALMARDAGEQAPPGAGAPAHTIAATGLEVEISDPLDAGVGYVYLFVGDGTLAPGAGQDYVAYDFVLLAGEYIPDYDTLSGPNPEDSAAQSPYYRTHFSDRWIRDELNVLVGASSGADILDRHKNMFGPGNCTRTENTFSNGEGAFFANIDGPVRAIRSYMGANSGPLTQRDHVFYEQRHDITTFLRVHSIPGVMDAYDYSPEATGMTYFNDLNTAGAPIDGEPDAVVAGAIEWEMASGAQGTVIISHALVTDIDPFSYTSYYSDDATPSVTQCTGDDFEYAMSGPWINQSIPNTDPFFGAHNILHSRRVVYYEGPGQTVATAALRHYQATTPLTVSVIAYGALAGDLDGDGDVDLDDFGLFAACYNGANNPPAPTCPPGVDADLDGDGDVDLDDFAILAANYTGSL